MRDNINENKEAYIKQNVPRYITIKGNDIYYKDPPLKNDIFVYRCRKAKCKYYIKINRDNLKKIEEKNHDIEYIEVNAHNKHNNSNEIVNLENEENIIRTEKENNSLAEKLIKTNINEPLDFHLQNFKLNKINWKKNKIKNLLYTIKESIYPKEEIFSLNIDKITIKLSSDKNTEQNFCLFKGEFINYKKNKKLEKFIIFMTEFQINLFTNVTEIFIDGTFKIVP